MSKHYSEKIIIAFLTNDTLEGIAKDTGISRQTIAKYRDDPKLKQMINDYRVAMIQKSLSKMQSELYKTIETLVEIRDSEDTPKQTKVNACQILLNQCSKWTDTIDILDRLQRLEDITKANI